MPDKVTYYAVVNDLSSRERPAGVFRRTYTEMAVGPMRRSPGICDREYSTSLISAERGDLENEFIEITEAKPTRSSTVSGLQSPARPTATEIEGPA